MCDETELDRIDAIGTGPGQFARRQGQGDGIAVVGQLCGHTDGEFGIGHRQGGQLRADLLGQPLGRLPPDRAEINCGLA
ncbi:Uncharacterised protein [Mycobacterium tuberculosis]|uniref:Uncharacterized protein n=1 Tax=Mycobacterium tuberculosis TaxID=1773 RepID=A0A0T9E9D9_MYCTX|nr:Uncharacterised protein [Mycobacterium tuberculosis]CKP74752.1 Uncharacterised protein [Mycobacterium tuberculosis]CKR91712.1 Uncharacterised protein [Mycobacterium tuberculosis]CKS96347.1 Uncharacterised protein [Mycobacterium tuberculosis]CKV15986.1 Uncharacterised protein [Mycobacterium tuberculosis]